MIPTSGAIAIPYPPTRAGTRRSMMAGEDRDPREMARQADGVIFNPARSSLSCSSQDSDSLRRDDLFERLSGTVDCLGDLHALRRFGVQPLRRRWTSWHALAVCGRARRREHMSYRRQHRRTGARGDIGYSFRLAPIPRRCLPFCR